jgi:hypothetical protein
LPNYLQLDDSKDIAFTHNQIVSAFDIDFGSSIFAIQYYIANSYSSWFVFFARTSSYYSATLWFFFCSIGDNDASSSFLFCGISLYDYTVVKRSYAYA